MLKKAKNPQNIWSFQKKAVPLRPNMRIRARKSVEYLLNDITWYKMNRSLNVFFGLVVCGGLIAGLFIWTKRSVSDECVFNPHDFYNSIGGSSYSTGSSSVVSGATDGGWTVPMRSSSSMFRHRGASSYAPAYSAPNSPIASSPYRLDASASPLYTTSSATMKSFGGGNAMGGGVSMSGGAVRSAGGSVSMSGGAVSGSFASSPLASSPLASNLSPLASSPVAITDPAAAAASYDGIGNTTNGPRGMRGRRNGGPSGFGNDWWRWLDDWYNLENGNTLWGPQNADGTWCLTYWDLQKAYQEWCAYMESKGMAGALPSEDVWIAWFMNSEGNPYEGTNGRFQYVPVGDALPLLLIALLYALLVFMKSKKNQGLTSNNIVF